MSAITAKASRKMKKYAVLTREPRCFLGSFDFSWEQRKLSEITDKVTEKNAGLQYVETFTNSAEFGIISQRDFFDHDIAKLGSLDGYYIVKNEDFVYNPRISTSAPVGPINRNKLGRTGVMSPLYTVFRPHDIDTTYLEYFFKCGYWHSFMNFNGDSGARSDRFSIRDNVFFQMPIPIPDIDEQRKIGELLTCLDNLITLHQRKCALLFSSFQALISMMFTTSTFSWEQRKFGEITSKYEDPVPTPHDGYYRLGIRSHAKGTFHSYVAKGQELETAQMHRVAAGNFIVNITFGWEHAVAITDKNDAGKLVSHRFPQFSFAEGMVPEFFRYVIVDEKFRHHLWLASPGGAGRNRVLKLDEMLNYLMRFPSRDEQIKIAEFFRHLDNLITLHQRKCISFTGRAGRLISTVNKKRITSSWEQRKLGELALFNPKDELPQTFEYVDLESVVGTEMLSHRAEVKSSAPSRAQRLAHTGDLFYQTVRPYQKNNYLFEKPDNNYVFSTGYAQMRPYVDGYFLLSLVQSERFVKVVLDNCTGTSYPAINANDLAEIEVAAPSDESEAQKIGTIFRSIDNLITLHQRKPFLMKWRTSDANRNQTNRLVL